jgi:3-oxoacyl-[acyl-carrier-protein] synthase-3
MRAKGNGVMSQVSIAATASILPEAVVSNREIGERLIAGANLGVSGAGLIHETRVRAELIEKKTGLRERRFFERDVSPARVGGDLLERLMAGVPWHELDAVIISSSSTQGFPGLSQQIVASAKGRHAGLGDPFVLDIGSNACTGFMYGLTVAAGLIKGMGYRKVAVLAVEFASRCISYDPLSFGTSTLFGDAAAGFLVESGENGLATLHDIRAGSMLDETTVGLIRGSGMQASRLDLEVPQAVRWFMAGPPVAIGATRILVDEIKRYQAAGARIDWLIPHQANLTRILIPACKATGVDPARLRTTFGETGNTSSASIPLALDALVREGGLQHGETALLIGFGASFTVGSALLVFTGVGGGARETAAAEPAETARG